MLPTFKRKKNECWKLHFPKNVNKYHFYILNKPKLAYNMGVRHIYTHELDFKVFVINCWGLKYIYIY